MNTDFLNQSIEFVKGVGPARSKLLGEELNLKTIKDLIDFYPFRYIDRSRFYKIEEIPKNQSEVQIIGKIKSIRRTKVRYRDRLNCEFYDNSGRIDLIWYRGFNWVEESLNTNDEYVVYGKVTWFGNKPSIAHPEIKSKSNFDRNVPRRLHGIYSSTERLVNEGVTQKYFIKIIYNVLNSIQNHIKENLSSSILQEYKLINRYKAIVNIHLPESQELLTESTKRLKFEELFFNQLGFQLTKNDRIQKLNGFKFEKVGNNLNEFYKNTLPFELTGDQKKVIKEIRNDFLNGKQMNRLLQGDVGSGKTIVSLMVMLIAIDNGFQSCILAPTEILANQHFKSLSELLIDYDVKVDLLTGSSKTRERNLIHSNLLSGKTNILVGTHAILEDVVKFKNLGLSIIDEQHRFGLSQLHQLRGRVGRGNDESYCVLMTKDKLSEDSKLRVETMVKVSDGFKLAEVDLKLRGPGDMLGTRQSGMLRFKLADIVYDTEILNNARNSAIKILNTDPRLSKNENLPIRDEISTSSNSKNLWRYIS